MTTRDRYLVIAGIVFGLVLGGAIFGLSRLVHPQLTQAQAPDIKPSYQTAPDDSVNKNFSHEHHGVPSSEPTETLGATQLTEEEQRSIGIQTVVVGHRAIRREFLTTARVEEPETRLTTISARVGGRIDGLHLDFTGQPV